MTTKIYHVCKCAAVSAALLTATVGLAAWGDEDEDVNNRPEFVTRGVGNDIEVNKATQTITPWPKYVRDRKLVVSGARAALGLQRYETNTSIAPRPINTTTGTIQIDTPSGSSSGTASVAK